MIAADPEVYYRSEPSVNQKCPCHSGKPYHECCQKYHRGALPEDVVSLMRSRYAAYALGLAQYIIETTHPNNSSCSLPRDQWTKEILSFSKNTQFAGLSILEHADGPCTGAVTFYADLRQRGKDVSFTEKSRFEKLNGKWLYESGEIINSR